ncbi:MAG TPA: sodium:solute symporter family protein [Longimicrobiaceae bacterium]|nr:sodium:solute symporter family protein [Longimicrobiaceae bacterium]
MNLAPLDWLIIAAYFVLSAGIGLAYAKRAGENASEFFAAGRSLPWWLAGTSMVATTFAADTPLAIAGMVSENGVAGNWLWWNMVMSGILTVFFFAHLWRRAEVLTDAEFAEIRYAGGPASVLRVFRALYSALPINLIIMGWVNLAMLEILGVVLGVEPLPAFAFMFAITVLYSLLSGLWGVVVTDFIQFAIAMGGSIVLAVYAVNAAGGISGLEAKLPDHFGSLDAALNILPQQGAAWMPVTAFLAYLAVQWWATSYPGAEPGGGGYIAQRIFSARTERDGVLSTLWFNVAQYAVRPWPWIMTALAVIVIYPTETDPSTAYLRSIVDLLPAGLKGLLVAAFAAAYMSTIATQLNWGASYLINDIYLRYLRPDAPEKRVIWLSRAATALMFLLSSVVTWWLYLHGSIEGAWRIIIAIGAGTGLVMILRWYWWRINAWTEISAMAAALVAFSVLTFGGIFDPTDPLEGTYLMLTTTVITTVVWVVVTFLTPPTPEEKLEAFYLRVRPGGPGWGRIQRKLGFADPMAGGRLAFANFFAGVISVYASLFAVGKLIFGEWEMAIAFGAAAVLSFAFIAWSLRRQQPWSIPSPPDPEAHEARRAAATLIP